MKKSVKITSLVCTAALLVSSVLSPVSTVVQAKAKKPAISKKKLSMKVGKTAKLSVKRAQGWKIRGKDYGEEKRHGEDHRDSKKRKDASYVNL